MRRYQSRKDVATLLDRQNLRDRMSLPISFGEVTNQLQPTPRVLKEAFNPVSEFLMWPEQRVDFDIIGLKCVIRQELIRS